MTQQPFRSSALRGAVDLSSLGGRPAPARASAGMPSAPSGGTGTPGAGPGGGAPAGAGGQSEGAVPGRKGALVQADDASFEAIVNASMTTPVVLVLWTSQVPESETHLRELAAAVATKEGRFQVAGADLGASPGVLQALTPVLQQVFGQVTALPVVLGLLAGQPMPFYLGVQPMEQVDQLLDKFLEAAVTNAITGRVELSPGDVGATAAAAADRTDQDEEQDLPPLHQAAYDAIERGDWSAASDAYEQALAENPADEEARLGLGQVRLLQRTGSLDPTAVRQAAADRPDDVQAQLDAADLDLVGGHVEDAFLRLVDAVRRTAGEDRDRVRTHLLEQFEVVGASDERVQKARRALMSALF